MLENKHPLRTENILDSFKDIISNNESLNLIVDLITREYIQNLIYGNYERVSLLEAVAKNLSVSINPNFVFTIIYDDFWIVCENYDNSKRYQIKKKLKDETRNFAQSYNAISTTLIGTDKVILLLSTADLEKYHAIDFASEFANKLLLYLQSVTGYSISIGISNYYTSYTKTHIAYEESFKSLEDIFKKGKGNILVAERDIKNNQVFSSSKLVHDLIIQIGLKNVIEINKLIDNFYNTMIDNNVSETYMRSNTIVVLSEIFEYFNNYILSEKILVADYISSVLKISTVSELNVYLRKILSKIVSMIVGNARENINILNAKSYIDKYYSLPITLEKISFVAGYNESYFSRTFKKVVGESFSNYLMQTRINAAKEIILNSSLPLVEISFQVGFENYSYFSSKFKTITGMTPIEFRDKKEK